MPLLPAAAWLPATRRVETTVSVDGRTGSGMCLLRLMLTDFGGKIWQRDLDSAVVEL